MPAHALLWDFLRILPPDANIVNETQKAHHVTASACIDCACINCSSRETAWKGLTKEEKKNEKKVITFYERDMTICNSLISACSLG